ncbi:carboxyl transferase domain-containing protein [Paludicola sp. MB14-C6]|uniref:acyl-CoA carboxylase subunit beta n=1 Tax=Paludihabitans sp. MB14-C6 TaxID=3070656 RepID=UPI0027DD9B69|nr:carboxyl transferase domain-containing protein [Paludicola sp. MB14-C6]WMJ22242.1 carboxyl transferase domain-containing protein [Paludicola sp. MB14-C6]
MSQAKLNKLVELGNKIDQNAPARKRITTLFDADSFVELDAFALSGDDTAGVVAGYGLVEGAIVYAYSQDVTVNSGAVSKVHAKKIRKIYELAAKTGCPVVSILDSNGAKLDEANMMLSAYSKMLMWSNNLSGVVPQIAVVLGTCAGASAMLAASADFVVMSKNGELFMTAPFVTSANGDKTENAGSAENAAKAGVASVVCEDEDACLDSVRRLITMLPTNNLTAAPLFDYAENAQTFDPEGCPKLVAEAIADVDSLFEINKDYANGAYTYLGTVAGITTAFVVTSKNNPLDAAACDKVARFVKICDAFNIPMVTFVNTNGFEMTADVSIIKKAAELASAYAEATTAKISIITGKAYGAAYIALGAKNANADVTLAWPQAEISALAPETAVEFLWADRYKGTDNLQATRKELVEEYIDTVASPFEAAKGGYIENVIAPESTRATVINMLDMLAGKRASKLPKKHATI